MPRKSKEIKSNKEEETPELNRRRSARLATVDTKVKTKEASPAKTPKRPAAKRASKEVPKTAEEENVNSNLESNTQVDKVEQDGDKATVKQIEEVEAKKLKTDEESTDEKKLEIVTTEESPVVVNDDMEEKKVCEETKEISEVAATEVDQNHLNNDNEKVEPSSI